MVVYYWLAFYFLSFFMNKFLILPFASKISDLSNYQYDEIGPTGHYHLVIDSLGTFELAPNANNPLHS